MASPPPPYPPPPCHFASLPLAPPARLVRCYVLFDAMLCGDARGGGIAVQWGSSQHVTMGLQGTWVLWCLRHMGDAMLTQLTADWALPRCARSVMVPQPILFYFRAALQGYLLLLCLRSAGSTGAVECISPHPPPSRFDHARSKQRSRPIAPCDLPLEPLTVPPTLTRVALGLRVPFVGVQVGYWPHEALCTLLETITASKSQPPACSTAVLMIPREHDRGQTAGVWLTWQVLPSPLASRLPPLWHHPHGWCAVTVHNFQCTDVVR